jgi:hypothetical protein
MKLKKHLNRKNKDTGQKFYRYDITINPEIVKDLNWKDGDELGAEVKGKELRIKKK